MEREIFVVRHAETEMNVKKIRYDNFGKDEYYPITNLGKKMASETGKYLKKFGKFDLIVSSPRDRCIQTAELIAKQIGYSKKITTSDLLLEQKAGKLNLMNRDEVKLFMDKNTKLKKLREKINNEINEFKKIKLNQKFYDELCKYTGQESYDVLLERYELFLDNISKIKEKRILVVTHNGTLNHMNNMICNINSYCDAWLMPLEYTI